MNEAVEAPRLIPIPGVVCARPKCGKPLAWRVGVGRYVISHVDGDDLCFRESVLLNQCDRMAANEAFRDADAAFAAALTNPTADEKGAGR